MDLEQKREQNKNQSFDLYSLPQRITQQAGQNINKQDRSNNEEHQINTEVSSQSNNINQYQGFQILGKQSLNQTLMVQLYNGNVVWHRGQVLFSSNSVKQREENEEVGRGFLQNLKFWDGTTKMLINKGDKMEYYVLRKSQPRDGKILILSEQIYNNHFYVNIDHVLLTNTSYTLRTHTQLKKLKLIASQNVNMQTPKLMVVLQSTRDTAIIQKYLAEGQHLYLLNAKIIAMSQLISYKWQRKNKMVRLTGPGFVFFQPISKSRSLLPVRNRQIVLSNIFLIIFIILLYWIQYMFLQ